MKTPLLDGIQKTALSVMDDPGAWWRDPKIRKMERAFYDTGKLNPTAYRKTALRAIDELVDEMRAYRHKQAQRHARGEKYRPGGLFKWFRKKRLVEKPLPESETNLGDLLDLRKRFTKPYIKGKPHPLYDIVIEGNEHGIPIDVPSEKEAIAMKTPLLDGIEKEAANKLIWGLGGLAAGVFGVPYLKKKYLGVRPATQRRFEQGDPQYGMRRAQIIQTR